MKTASSLNSNPAVVANVLSGIDNLSPGLYPVPGLVISKIEYVVFFGSPLIVG